jgi:hypothetical protein
VQLTGLDLLLWALSLAGHCILLAVLFVRHRAASFPVFTTLIAANIFRTAVLYSTHRFGSAENYFYTYWTLAIVDVAIQLAVVYELASHVFRPLGAWAPDVRQSFLALVSVSLLIAGVLTWLATPPARLLRLVIVIRGNFFSSVLMSELLVAMMALSVSMGLPWRTHAARLAQGFGVYSLFGILTETAHTYFGSARGNNTYQLISHIRIGLYLLCLTYWIVSLALQEPAPRRLPEVLHNELRALQKRAALVLQNIRIMGSAS